MLNQSDIEESKAEPQDLVAALYATPGGGTVQKAGPVYCGAQGRWRWVFGDFGGPPSLRRVRWPVGWCWDVPAAMRHRNWAGCD
jgi:hypothetical protein